MVRLLGTIEGIESKLLSRVGSKFFDSENKISSGVYGNESLAAKHDVTLKLSFLIEIFLWHKEKFAFELIVCS